MNEQLASAIRSLFLFLGGVAVAKGWVDNTTMLALVGGLMSFIPAILSFRAHSHAGIIASAAAIPDVKAIVTTPAISNSPQFIADDKVVSSGAAVQP